MEVYYYYKLPVIFSPQGTHPCVIPQCSPSDASLGMAEA